MRDLASMVWIEYKKAMRSRMILTTVIASLLLPAGIAFLILVSKNPDVSQKLGLVGAKANLVAFAAADWPTYTGMLGQFIAAGGFIIAVFAIAWVFGREFSDGTVKDLLAVPVRRWDILLAKFILAAVWSVVLVMVIFASGLVAGALLKLPGASTEAILRAAAATVVAAFLLVPVILPFGLFASIGRGYLLPIALAVVAMLLMNLALVIGRGEYFPWAIPLIYIQGETPLNPGSYLILLLTGLASLYATYLWWQRADQSR